MASSEASSEADVTINHPYITADQKIIPSDLLFYMQNKVHSCSQDDIVKSCTNFYNDEYVWEEKEKFFLAIGKKPIKRRTSDKKIEDLNDILTEISVRDLGDEFQPTCKKHQERESSAITISITANATMSSSTSVSHFSPLSLILTGD